jgi:hypothetical protein
MAYFKINGNDYSQYTSALKVINNTNYNAQTNAAGDTVADYINKKRTIEVGIIPLDASIMQQLQEDVDKFNVKLSFLNPKTNELAENVDCIIPADEVEYYTIQTNKISFKAVTLTFTEL